MGIIEESKYPSIIELCKAAASCKAQSEIRDVQAQATMEVNEDLRAELDEKIAAVRGEPEPDWSEDPKFQADAAKEEELDEELKDTWKAVTEKKKAYYLAFKAAMDLK